MLNLSEIKTLEDSRESLDRFMMDQYYAPYPDIRVSRKEEEEEGLG